MALGILDLSIVTDQLVDQLTAFAATFAPLVTDPFVLKFTGLAPDVARQSTDADCKVSVYLFHVAADRFYRSTYPTGGQPQRIPEQPLALTLYYLITAYSPTSHNNEQRAMSVVLKCFHEAPIKKLNTATEEFTLTLEPQTVDELSRLWQSINSPMRLSAVYRVSVIFISAPEPPPPQPVRHMPTFDPPYDIGPIRPEPPPVPIAEADETGLVALTIATADFATGVTTATLRALTLLETTTATYPLAARHFHVVDPRNLQLRVPLFTPAGQYLLSVQPSATRPVLGYQLTVPALVRTVVADSSGFAVVAIDDAHFSSTSEVALDGAPVTVTTIDPPAPGQFRVVDDNTLLLCAPAGTLSGRHPLRVVPTTGKELHLWLAVP
jgi:hypothetical protein